MAEIYDGSQDFERVIERSFNSCMAEGLTVSAILKETIDNDIVGKEYEKCLMKSAVVSLEYVVKKESLSPTELRECLLEKEIIEERENLMVLAQTNNKLALSALKSCSTNVSDKRSNQIFFENVKSEISTELQVIPSLSKDSTYSTVIQDLEGDCDQGCKEKVKASIDQVVLSRYLASTHSIEANEELEICLERENAEEIH